MYFIFLESQYALYVILFSERNKSRTTLPCKKEKHKQVCSRDTIVLFKVRLNNTMTEFEKFIFLRENLIGNSHLSQLSKDLSN